MEVLKFLFYILVFPGFLFCSVMGMFLSGIDKRLVAILQRRIGSSILQPFYDFLKFLRKKTIVTRATIKTFAAPVIGLISIVTASLFIPILNFSAFSGTADLVVILYLLMIPTAALIIGRAASASSYTGVDISKEIIGNTSYELPFVIILLAIGKKVGMAVNDGAITFSLVKIIQYQAQNGPIIANWSMIPAMLGMLLVIPFKIGSLPFDETEEKNEMSEVSLGEYSGAPLEIFKLNHSIKLFIMVWLFITLFFSGAGTGIVIVDILIQVILCIAVAAISISFLKVIIAKIRVEKLLKLFWIYPTVLAGISLILVWLGL